MADRVVEDRYLTGQRDMRQRLADAFTTAAARDMTMPLPFVISVVWAMPIVDRPVAEVERDARQLLGRPDTDSPAPPTHS